MIGWHKVTARLLADVLEKHGCTTVDDLEQRLKEREELQRVGREQGRSIESLAEQLASAENERDKLTAFSASSNQKRIGMMVARDAAREELKRLRSFVEDENGRNLIQRYQACALAIWMLFDRDPLPSDSSAYGWCERLEELVSRGVLAPASDASKRWVEP